MRRGPAPAHPCSAARPASARDATAADDAPFPGDCPSPAPRALRSASLGPMPSPRASTTGPDPATAAALRARYLRVRERSRRLATPLSAEDAQLQSMPDASPAKWHLAHTTWFFARFVLADPSAIPAGWDGLFNSYYVGAGERHPRRIAFGVSADRRDCRAHRASGRSASTVSVAARLFVC